MTAPKRPNIVLIVADDQRYDTIQAWGNPEIRTPVLDSLAAGGVSFTKTYITGGMDGAVCVPSRACLHTGAHALNAVQGMTIHPEAAVLPHVLRESGYHTFATGKWHNDKASFVKGFSDGGKIFFGGMSGHREVPVFDYDPAGGYGPDRQYVEEKFSTDLFTDAAVEFIRGYREEKPFFLYLAYTSPHDPRTAPEEYAARYRPEDITVPPNFLPEHPFDIGEMDIRDELLEPLPRTPQMVQRHTADYYAMITHHDDRVGNVLQALRDTGQWENTLIVFTADHGLALGRHGLLGKQNLYEHSIRIPLIMAGPGLPSGQRHDGLACQFDIFPTLCELAGIPVPGTVEGKSLLPLVRGEKNPIHDSVFTVYKRFQRTVTDGEWKLIRYYRPEGRADGTDCLQLFHLKEDPWETNDLSGDPSNTAQKRRLAEMLSAWQARYRDPLAGRPVIP